MSDPVYVRIGVDEGQVLLMFADQPDGTGQRSISHWHIDPAQCLDIIEAMAQAAFEADSGLKPVGDVAKSQIIERTRMKLTTRYSLMFQTARWDKSISDGKLAQDVTCLLYTSDAADE